MPSYIHFDALGSTRELTDSSETVTDTFLYDAWGNEVSRTGTTVIPFTWNGMWGYYWDADTGTFQVRARPLEPEIAVWLVIDPIGFGTGDVNLYRYVANSPTNFIDPTGHDREIVMWLSHMYLAVDTYDNTGAVNGRVYLNFDRRGYVIDSFLPGGTFPSVP